MKKTELKHWILPLLLGMAPSAQAVLSPLLPGISIQPNIIKAGSATKVIVTANNPTTAIMPSVRLSFGASPYCSEMVSGLALKTVPTLTFSAPNSIATGKCSIVYWYGTYRSICTVNNLSPNETATVTYKLSTSTKNKAQNIDLSSCGWDVWDTALPHFPTANATLTIL